MSFSWYESDLPASLTATYAARADEAIRQEVRERAGILMRLGYSQKEAAARCKERLQWEFELHGKPAALGEVENLVAGVFSRNTAKR